MINIMKCEDCKVAYEYETQFKPTCLKRFCKQCSIMRNRKRANESYQMKRKIIKDIKIKVQKKIKTTFNNGSLQWDEPSFVI